MGLDEAHGWSWNQTEFPVKTDSPSKTAVDRACSGASFDGRYYYLASVRKPNGYRLSLSLSVR